MSRSRAHRDLVVAAGGAILLHGAVFLAFAAAPSSLTTADAMAKRPAPMRVTLVSARSPRIDDRPQTTATKPVVRPPSDRAGLSRRAARTDVPAMSALSALSATSIAPTARSLALSVPDAARPRSAHSPALAIDTPTALAIEHFAVPRAETPIDTRPPQGLTAAKTVFEAPTVIDNPSPRYPRSARQKDQEGTVELRVHVSPRGKPGVIDITRSSGHASLDRAAVRAVRRWRFLPATRDGLTIDHWIEIPIEFDLTEAGD